MTKDIEMEEDLETKTFSNNHNVEDIDKLVNRELKEGDFWYVLDNKWFQTYKQYLQSCNAVNNPGPIDNSDLFKVTENNKPKSLKEKLVENEDFVYVPEILWTDLVEEFGLTGEKHIIRRKVIDRPTARSNYKILELYPVELKLCLHGTKQEIITAQFSQVTSLKELENSIRTRFNVDDKSETQLWACGSLLNAYDPESESKKNDDTTLVDSGLSSGSIVTLEVQNSDGTWPSSRPRFGAIATRSSKITPGLCGLMNLGNTCFMNSALQCLSNTPPLTEYFIADKYWDELNADNPLGMGGEIAKTFGDLIKAMWSGQHAFLSPREFKQAVGKFSPQFSGFQQQDCQELMAFLLDGLHEDLNRVKKKPYIEIKQEIDKRPDSIVAAESWSNYLKRNDSIIVDTFHGLLKSTLVCPECDLVSVTFDPYCYLSLPLPVKRERAIDVMFVPARPINVGPEKKIKRVFKIGKLMVPKVGIVLDICTAVAKAINESKEVNGLTVNPSNLIVTEVHNCRLSRIYNQDESFTSNSDEVLIFEKLDDCTALPVYLRWDKGDESATLFGKPFFVNIKECTYEALYSAVKNYVEILTEEPTTTTTTTTTTNNTTTKETTQTDGDDEMVAVNNSNETDATTSSTQLNHKTPPPTSTATSSSTSTSSPSTVTNTLPSNLPPTTSSSEENDQPMEAKEENELNGDERPFTLKLINSFGTMPLGKIEKDKPLELGSKSYIAADFTKRFKVRSFDNEEISLRMNIQKNANTSSRSHNLSECIEQFTTVERLGEHDLWYCPRCKKRQQASKKFDIWSLPKVAIFHLKRFSYSKYWRDKLDTFVNFPLHNLDLGQYLINNPNKEKILYNLVAVANHYGGLGGGHYTAYGKNKETSSWYHFDDSNVSPATEDSVISKAAYVLLYIRQD